MNTSEAGEWHRYEDTITTPCLRDREMKTPGTQMMKAKLHRLFDTYWKLSDSIDKLREEVWDADDSFHRDRIASVHNVDSNIMTLCKYEPTIRADGTKDFSVPGPGAYTVKAGGTTYFSLGTEWNKITDTYGLDATGQNMFDYFNKPALDDAVRAGKEIRFSHNPEAYGECALKWEWDYLQEKHGYFALEKRGDFWYATK